MKKLITPAAIFLLITHTQAGAQSADNHISKGNQYYQASEYYLAEKQFRQALAKSPQNSTAQYNLANALYRQKKYQEALEILKSITQKNNKTLQSSAFYNTGVIYTRQNDLEASIEAYKNALRLKPDDNQTRENLQKALLELKRQQQNLQQIQNQRSRMNTKEAEQKLKELEQKEKQIQERLQNQSSKSGSALPKDW